MARNHTPHTSSGNYRCRECVVFALDNLIRVVESEANLSCYKNSKKIRRYLIDSVTRTKSRLVEVLADCREERRIHRSQSKENLITTFEAVNLDPIFEVFKELMPKLLERRERTNVSLKRAVVASTFIKEMLKVLHRGGTCDSLRSNGTGRLHARD